MEEVEAHKTPAAATSRGKGSAPYSAPVRGDLGDLGRTRRADPSAFAAEASQDGVGFDEPEWKLAFESFIRTFKVPSDNGGGNVDDDIWEREAPEQQQPFYLQQLYQLVELGAAQQGGEADNDASAEAEIRPFPIDLRHLQSANASLFNLTSAHPADAMVYMDEVLAKIAAEEYASIGLQNFYVKVSLFHHPLVRCMRDLDPQDIETLISINGIVIRCSPVIPDMRTAAFRCTNRLERNQQVVICGYEEFAHLANGEVQEPLECPQCQGKYCFDLIHSRCSFGNKQLLKLQETPESIPEGETPQTVVAYVFDELVDRAKPGDFVEITGIYRAVGVRLIPRQRLLKTVYRTMIDVNHIHKDSLNRFLFSDAALEGGSSGDNRDESGAVSGDTTTAHADRQKAGLDNFTASQIEHFQSIANDPNVYRNLVKSLAPNVWEAEDVKKGLLCQLFGASHKMIGNRSPRSDIHVLLCGDPSTAKSQLLKYVHNIAPRGVYTCGRGSSAVGLTASVSRDSESKEFVLESGAIILSDRGICCIDEFDKMDDSARTILHEVMEQQTVSIAKAGIVCSLNARAAILASANPINSRYNTRKSVVENINLPPTLFSRFDLIYLMLDTADPKIDRALARHLCELYSAGRDSGPTAVRGPPIDKKTFAQYISYAKIACHPKLPLETVTLLVKTYTDLRRKGLDGSGRGLTATPRQLESLLRLSEALARMQLAKEVTADHVIEATRLIQAATYSALIDPTTGRLDFDQINAGVSGGSRDRQAQMEKLVLEALESTSGAGLDKAALLEKVDAALRAASQSGLNPNDRELDRLLRELEGVGVVARLQGGKYVAQSAATV